MEVNYRNTPLKQVFSDLTDRYGIRFSYSEQFIPVHLRISYQSSGQSLKTVLTALCTQVGLEYREMGDQVFLRKDPNARQLTVIKQIRQTVRGTVMDAASKEPLTGANIRLFIFGQLSLFHY